MLHDTPCKSEQTLWVDEVWIKFSLAHERTKVSIPVTRIHCFSWDQLGDYGHFTESEGFCCTGNIFANIKPLISEVDMVPRQDPVIGDPFDNFIVIDSIGLSLPSIHTFNSSLATLSSQLVNAYLITRLVQCAPKGKFMSTYISSDVWLSH